MCLRGSGTLPARGGRRRDAHAVVEVETRQRSGLYDTAGRDAHSPERLVDLVKGRKVDMDPFVRLGSLAVVIGLVGGMGLIKGRKKKVR
jgi:hypothetical protein